MTETESTIMANAQGELPLRYIGTPSAEGEFFWTSGKDGFLRLLHCDDCDRFHHPPQPVCPYCHGRDLSPKPVAGTGTLAAFTINHQPFIPGFDPPYVFGFVEIDEDPTIRIATNIVGCDHSDVEIGMRLRVLFEHSGEWYVPLFEPVEAN
ncbi:MAG: OB-fold domain-containing protein [Acidobacteria bacterium]|nr:OB-fold domain-containing protein [Acidobacteriota bacterium]